MTYNHYMTDYGEVRVSDEEARTLKAAYDARLELAGTPFIESEVARKLFSRERAIIAACEAVARHKYVAA